MSHNEDGGETSGWVRLSVAVHHTELADDAVVDVGANTRYSGQSFIQSTFIKLISL